MIFGDINDPESEVSRTVQASKDVSTLRPEMGTHPQIYYIGLSQGGVSDPVSGYEDRSDALKEDFNAYKRNHAGQQFGDIEEGAGQTTPAGFARQLGGHMRDFFVDIGERMGILTRH